MCVCVCLSTYRALSKDSMLLYRHSAQCPAAIQMFLDENPRYWRFVPMTVEDASRPEQKIQASTLDFKTGDEHDCQKIQQFIHNLPAPSSPHFRFSPRQYHLQYVYFKSRRHLDMPNTHLDLYNAKIIAVCKCRVVDLVFLLHDVITCLSLSVLVPETGSTVLRQVVESLLITHADTALNSSGRLLVNKEEEEEKKKSSNSSSNALSNAHHDTIWYANLLRRPLPSLVTVTAIQEQQQ